MATVESRERRLQEAEMTKPTAPSRRTQIRRVADRAHYDRATIEAIVDAAYFCHIAFADEHGVHCIPTSCWREEGHLYVHGSNGSRMLKLLAQAQCCVTITHLDGLVLARSAFHHSMNYRSVVIYGQFEVVSGADKAHAFDRFLDRIDPARKDEVKPPDANELAATTVFRIGLDEAAAKIRSWGPVDDEADMARPVWAGVLPLAVQQLPPQPDGATAVPAPSYVRDWCSRVG